MSFVSFDDAPGNDSFVDFDAPPKPEDNSSDVLRGAKVAAKQLPQLGYGLMAGAGAAAESVLGEGGVSTAVKDYGVKKYQEASADISKDSKQSDSLTYSWDQAQQGNFGAMVDWLQYGLGYGGVQALEAIASAGIGSFVGKQALKQTAEHLASGMVAKEAARISATAEGAALASDAVSKIAVANVASKIGQTVGIGAQAYGMEGGEIFGDLTSQSKGVLSGDQLAKAFGATLAAGSLEFVGDKLGVDLMLGKSKIFSPAEAAKGISGKIARAGIGSVAAMPVEGGTEYLQTGLEEYGKGNESSILPWQQSESAHRQAIDAAGLGALGGTQMATVGGLMSAPTTDDAIRTAETLAFGSTIPPATEAIDQWKGGDIGPDGLLGPVQAGPTLIAGENGVGTPEQMTAAAEQSRMSALAPQPADAAGPGLINSSQLPVVGEQPAAAPSVTADDLTGAPVTADTSEPLVTPQARVPSDIEAYQAAIEKQANGELLSSYERAILDNGAPSTPSKLDVVTASPAEQGTAQRKLEREGSTPVSVAQQILADQERPSPLGQTPTTVGGVNEAQLSNEQLTAMIAAKDTHANTRRAAQAVLGARMSQPRGEQDANDAEQQLPPGASSNAAVPTSDVAAGREGLQTPTSPEAVAVKQIFGNDAQLRATTDAVQPNERVTVPMRAMLAQIGRLTGTKVVFFSADAADGATRSKDGNTVYINLRSSINPLQVMGHETTHVLKRKHREAWAAIREVVSGATDDAALAEFARDYWSAGGNETQREALSKAEADGTLGDLLASKPEWLKSSEVSLRDFIHDEMIADLGGTRWTDADFWNNVFARIEAQHGNEKARGIIERLVAAVKEMINKFLVITRRDGFAEFRTENALSQRVTPEQLQDIKTSIEKAYAQFISSERRNEPGGYTAGTENPTTIADVEFADVNSERRVAMPEDRADYKIETLIEAPHGKDATARTPEQLRDLRRKAAMLERPKDGLFFRVTEDGEAIATGEPHTKIPQTLRDFAKKFDLKFVARRRVPDGARNMFPGNSAPMPIDNRESGAMYSSEMGKTADRTDVSRFSPARIKEHPIEGREAEKIKALGFAVRGNIVSGSPPFISTINDVRKQIRQAVTDAMSDQAHPEDMVWYREAGRGLREYAHGDKALLEKLVRITAKLSQAAGVNSNVTGVIKAAYQIANGEAPAVGRFPNKFREDFAPAVAAAEFDNTLKGVDTKLRNFYRNLHDEAFQENRWPDAVVIDRHAINYIWKQPGKDTVASDAQYNYAERVIQLATKEFNKQTGKNVKPRDMQATLWGHWKRGDKALSDTEAATSNGGAWNYPQFFERATANVTAEVLPSTKVSDLDTRLTGKQKRAFHREALDLIFKDGHNELARRAGLVLYRETSSTGGYEDKINPNEITGAIAQKDAKLSGQSDTYHRYRFDAVDRYALAWQYIYKQDGVPWFRADRTLDPATLDAARARREKRISEGKKVADDNVPPIMSQGYYVTFDRDLTAEQEAVMFAALKGDISPDVGYTKMSPNSIAVVNYRGDDGVPFMMSDKDFKAAIDKFRHLENVTNSEPFAAESRYHYHDFSEDTQGTGILARDEIQSGQQDFRSWLEGRRDAFDALVARWEDRSAGRSRPDAARRGSDGAGVQESTRREAVSAEGIHYSTQQLTSLSSYYFGTGLKGAELPRVRDAADARLKQRIYFYVNTGNGIKREQGVGPYAHRAQLDGLYDIEADPLDLVPNAQGDANMLESSILDRGFDGTLSQTYGIAVLLGPRTVPVERAAPGAPAWQAMRAEPSANGKARRALAARKDLPSGRLTGAEWRQKLPEMQDQLAHLSDTGRYYRDELLQRPVAQMSEKRLAPNGKPSRLNDEQWQQVRTPAFKAWFGDWEKHATADNAVGSLWSDENVSKVVDENGEPLVVYHGTQQGGFDVMDPGKGNRHRKPMLFATADQVTARSYSGYQNEIAVVDQQEYDRWDELRSTAAYGERKMSAADRAELRKLDKKYNIDGFDPTDKQRGVYHLFLNIRNPLESDFEGLNWDGQAGYDDWQVTNVDGDTEYLDNGRGVLSEQEARDLLGKLGGEEAGYSVIKAYGLGQTTNDVAHEAIEYGHDGAIIDNVVDDGGKHGYGTDPARVFVFFDSNQAKSATQNNGAFSPREDSILRSEKRAAIEEGASKLAAMPEAQRDDISPYDFKPGGYQAYALYEARKLLPKPSDKLKKVTDRNTFFLSQDAEYVANVDGEHYWVNKYEDPDAEDDETKFVYAFGSINDNDITGKETTTDQVDELLAEIRASRGVQRSEKRAPWYYSQLERAISDASPKVFSTGKQVALWLRANTAKLGVKRAEIEATGITDWLQTQGKVTQQQVQDYLAQGGVRLEETVLGTVNARQAELEAKYGTNLIRWPDTALEERDAILVAADRGGEPLSSGPKFSAYQLPGGENYREWLLTLPSEQSAKDALIRPLADATAAWRGAVEEFGPGNGSEPELRAERMRLAKAFDDASAATKAEFRSSHYPDTLNILAHIRTNERTDANGKRVLFIEEIQSDWAQKGRKEGFSIKRQANGLPEGFKIVKDGKFFEVEDASGDTYADIGKGPGKTEAEAIANALHNLKVLDERQGVPSAPFVTDTKSWTALALKRMIAHAVENGFDSVAWTTGEQQAARYDLSKQVKTVEYFPDTEVLRVFGLTGGKIMEQAVKPNEIEDHVGKEVAKKLLETPTVESGAGRAKHVVSGLDLKVGGEGMKGYYDGIVPQVANDVLKKIGGEKVETINVQTARVAKIGSNWGIYNETTNDIDQRTRDARVAMRRAASEQQGFTITDKMREAVGAGLPLFSERRDTTALGKSISSKLMSEKVAMILYDYGPFDGGCLICAKAIQLVHGGNLVRLVSKRAGTEHYGTEVDGVIYDAAGGFATPVEWKNYFAKEEHITRDLSVAHGFDPEGEAVDDPVKIKQVAKVLERSEPQRRAVDVWSKDFRAWFGNSAVVDDRGRPLQVFHGTSSDVAVFDQDRAGTNYPTTGGHQGFYFTDDSVIANTYAEQAGYSSLDGGENVMPVYLSLQNPVERKTSGSPDKYFDYNRNKILTAAKKAGSDGIIVRGGDRTLYIAFRPEQIKSAISNTGDYSLTDGDITRSTQRIIGDSGRQYTAAQEAFHARVGRDVAVPMIVERIKTWANKNWAQGLVDQFAPVKELSKHAYMLMRLSKGSTGAFEAFMQHGKLSIRDGAYDADTAGGVMQNVFFPLGKETTDFMYWIAGNRADKLAKEGREHLFSPADIAAAKSLAQGTTDFDYVMRNGTVTRDRTKIYADSLVKFNEFSKNVLDMAEQSGLIDGASRHLWEHEFYVPFYRVMDDKDGGVRGMNIKQGVIRQQAFKKLKGGSEQLNDLLSNTLMNWFHLIDASAKNRAAKATIDAAVTLGAAQPVAATMTQYTTSNGAMLPPGTKHTVWYVDNGRKTEFSVDDPHLLIALNGLDYAGLRGPAMDALSMTKHWLTLGVTASPFFKVRNLIRDSLQAVATSGLGYNVFTNIKEGTALTARDRQEYVSALAGGGLIRFGTMLEGNEAARTRQLIKIGAKDETILDSESKLQRFYDKYLEPTVTAYNELGNRGEEINRMALYDQLIKQGVSHAEAALQARDLMDFSMQGSFTTIRFLTQVVPFMNARLQGMYKLGRAAKEDPAKFAAVLGGVALASLALLAGNWDDDDWKKREDWDRDNYWWFKFGGTVFRIPKPFEIGAIATLAERSAELAFSNEMNGTRFRKVTTKLLSDQLSMNPIPQLVKPIIDVYANTDSFSGRPIETMGMERLQPEYRFTASTSMPARGLSTATAGMLSPVQIDHLVRGYFSWLGAFTVGAADMMIRSASDEPTKPTMDYWKFATGSMISETSSAGSRYVSQMYDQAAQLEQAYGTWHALQKEGKVAEARSFADSHREDLMRYKSVEQIKRAESKLNEQIRIIERSTMTPDAKRTRVDAIRVQKDAIARRLAARAL